jgi:hypothetical protein
VPCSRLSDRTLVGEAVIWSGDEEEGYLSSHRITSHATHLGANEYGPPTGPADRLHDDRRLPLPGELIVEEWLVRDHAAILRKLGLDVVTWRLCRRRPTGSRTG